MWLFTKTGFVSAVYKDGALQVRARDAKSLEALAAFTNSEVIKTPQADYPYRLFTDNQSFAKWATLQAQEIDYPNFKSAVSIQRDYPFAKALNKVWSAMHDVEDKEARSR